MPPRKRLAETARNRTPLRLIVTTAPPAKTRIADMVGVILCDRYIGSRLLSPFEFSALLEIWDRKSPISPIDPFDNVGRYLLTTVFCTGPRAKLRSVFFLDVFSYDTSEKGLHAFFVWLLVEAVIVF
jgi:hypothetical protein